MFEVLLQIKYLKIKLNYIRFKHVLNNRLVNKIVGYKLLSKRVLKYCLGDTAVSIGGRSLRVRQTSPGNMVRTWQLLQLAQRA